MYRNNKPQSILSRGSMFPKFCKSSYWFICYHQPMTSLTTFWKHSFCKFFSYVGKHISIISVYLVYTLCSEMLLSPFIGWFLIVNQWEVCKETFIVTFFLCCWTHSYFVYLVSALCFYNVTSSLMAWFLIIECLLTFKNHNKYNF